MYAVASIAVPLRDPVNERLMHLRLLNLFFSPQNHCHVHPPTLACQEFVLIPSRVAFRPELSTLSLSVCSTKISLTFFSMRPLHPKQICGCRMMSICSIISKPPKRLIVSFLYQTCV